MKKKLLITVGAGASIDFGLPSVGDVDSIFDACAGRLFPLVSDPTSNLYQYCRDAIGTYYGTASKPALRKWVNFEEVLYHSISKTHLLGTRITHCLERRSACASCKVFSTIYTEHRAEKNRTGVILRAI